MDETTAWYGLLLVFSGYALFGMICGTLCEIWDTGKLSWRWTGFYDLRQVSSLS